MRLLQMVRDMGGRRSCKCIELTPAPRVTLHSHQRELIAAPSPRSRQSLASPEAH